MSAAVSIAVESVEDAELAELRASEKRNRARWKAELEAQASNDAVAPAPVTPSNRTSLDGLLGDLLGGGDDALDRRIAEIQRRAREHEAACSAEYCDQCGRYRCSACRSAVVTDYGHACRACRLREAVSASGLPKRYQDAIAHLKTRVRNAKAIELAGKQIGRKHNIVFIGPSGAGKTTLAGARFLATVGWLIDAGRPVRGMMFASAIDLGLARSQHRLGAGEAELVADAMAASLLLLDDLGAESTRDGDVIAAVLHARHNDDAPSWITTGLSAQEIGARYGGGLERRVFEGATIIDCHGGAQR